MGIKGEGPELYNHQLSRTLAKPVMVPAGRFAPVGEASARASGEPVSKTLDTRLRRYDGQGGSFRKYRCSIKHANVEKYISRPTSQRVYERP